MKAIVALLAVASMPAIATDSHRQGAYSDHQRMINRASELVPWCRSEAESRYVARNITPYQWTASYHDRSNVLYVEGRLRVHGDDVAVRCRIARGSRDSYATIEIDDPIL